MTKKSRRRNARAARHAADEAPANAIAAESASPDLAPKADDSSLSPERGAPAEMDSAEARHAESGEMPAKAAADEAAQQPEQKAVESASGNAAEKAGAADAAGEADEKAVETVAEKAAQPPLQAPRVPLWGRRLVKAGAAILLAAALGAGWLYWDLVKRPLAMPEGTDAVDVMVEEGDAAIRVVQKIREAGLDVSGRQIRLLLRWYPDAVNRFRVGLYRFERGVTAKGVLETLMAPPVIDQQVRIPDGAPIWEVERILENGVNLKRAAADLSSATLREKLGLADYPSIEGFIAPDTYRYSSGSTDFSILKMAVARQKKLLQSAWEAKSPLAAELKTPYELLILASIIEKETGVKGDRHLVSSVFHNRLKAGMPLQTDPTVIYGLGPNWRGRLTRKDLQTVTPYNTYKIPALPPTPISNPTPASIEAAANPADTQYLYFVARGDGSSEFTTNLKDHNRAIQHFIFEKKVQSPFRSKFRGELTNAPASSSAAAAQPSSRAPAAQPDEAKRALASP